MPAKLTNAELLRRARAVRKIRSRLGDAESAARRVLRWGKPTADEEAEAKAILTTVDRLWPDVLGQGKRDR